VTGYVRRRPILSTVNAERGSVSVMAPVLIASVMAVLGLAFDGGAAITAHERAIGVAEQAARAGAQQVSIASVRSATGTYRLVPDAASGAARSFLRRAGVSGGRVQVRHDATGDFVEVTVPWTHPAVFGRLLGLREFTGTGTARARLCHGVVFEESC
jgi:hypothetical protein